VTMSTEPEHYNAFDPFDTLGSISDASMKTLNAMRDANLQSWSKMMIDLVNSDAYSEATAKWLDSYLTLSQPFQQVLDTTMVQVLTKLNMPLRTDITALAERMTNIEMRLDDLDAKLDEIQQAIAALAKAKPTAATPAKAKGEH
jgi:hypothetical protein